MSESEVLLTAAGLRTYERELDELKRVRRQEIAERIKQAIEYGDISENSEYDSAKNEQAFIEQRITELERMLRKATIINEDDVAIVDEVVLGAQVRILQIEKKQEFQYILVGSMEANPLQKRISNESPLGKVLLGKRVGDVVEVPAPTGLIRYEILEIAKV